MGMLAYKTEGMKEIPRNCNDCICHWCRLPLKRNKLEPELKKEYYSKRHKQCPLIVSLTQINLDE